MKMNNWLESVYSDGSQYFVSNPYPKLGEVVKVLLRVKKNNDICHILKRQMENGEEKVDAMTKVHSTEELFVEIPEVMFGCNDYYIIDMKINEPLVSYHFIITTEQDIYFYNQEKISKNPPLEYFDFKVKADYQPSRWVHKSVFYQIFPDRFYNGDTSNDVETGQYMFDGHPTTKMEWGIAPKEYKEVFCLDFYGGDLQGVTQKLDYLKSMNFTGIYINPIFYAATSHKYDCLDYFKVDPVFGGDEALVGLTETMHKKDMHLMVDVSINHTGTAHKWFNKEAIFFDQSEGAYLNPDCEEREYYIWNDNNEYKCWADVDTLPTLNYKSEKLRDKLYRSEDSFVKHWLKPPFNIDAWRFDVASTMARLDKDQMSNDVFRGIRESAKAVNEEAYIIGEMWTDATEHLQGDQWDSAMNYFGFTRPVRQFVGDVELYFSRRDELKDILPEMKAEQLATRVIQQLAVIPHQLQLVQFNLINSHDVPRLYNNPVIDFEDNKAAMTMMYTFPGTPNVYYGDEVGIDGRINSVEGCRYPMVWEEEKQNQTCIELFKELGDLKRHYEPLAEGGFKILYAEDKTFIYARFTHKEAVFIGIHLDEKEKTVQVPTMGIATQESLEFSFADGKETKMIFFDSIR